jgi:hypothetical protein
MDVSLDHGMLRWRVYQAERQLSSFLIGQNGIKQTTRPWKVCIWAAGA